MNQQEFYNLDEVKVQLEIQGSNPYGSANHRTAFEEVEKIADKYGVGDEYRKAGGGIYD